MRSARLVAPVLLMLALLAVVFTSRAIRGTAPDAPQAADGSQPPAHSPQAGSRPTDRAESPPVDAAAPDLRREFEAHVARLARLVDRDGLSAQQLRDEDGDAVRFLEAHVAESRAEIRAIIVRRGWLEPMSTLLGQLLTDEERQQMCAEAYRRMDEKVPVEGVQRAYAYLEMTRDASLPLGVRSHAFLLLQFTPEFDDPALQGQVVSLLSAVKEPYVRSLIFDLSLRFQSGTEVHAQALEAALMAIASRTEARGTTAEIVFALAQLPARTFDRHGARIESALAALLADEARRAVPDRHVLRELGYSFLERPTIPSPGAFAQARDLLRSERPAEVRVAAASLLLPDLKDRAQDPAALGFAAQARDVLIDALREERSEAVVARIVEGLSYSPDPKAAAALRSLADERPDLRVVIEKALARRSRHER